MPKVISWVYGLGTKEFYDGFYGDPSKNPVAISYQKVFKMKYDPKPLQKTIDDLNEANAMACIAALDNESLGNKVPLEYIAGLVKQYPNLFIGGAGADPRKGYGAAKELDKAVKMFPVKYIYVQPMQSMIPPSDRSYYPLYTRACDLGIPVYIACSVHYNLKAPQNIQHPDTIDQIAVDFPDLTIVCRHALFPWIWELAAVMMRHENVYLDVSNFRHKYLHPEWIRMINSQFRERTVYGIGYGAFSLKQNIEEFMALPLRDDVKENILYKTSSKILKIKND